MMTVILLESHIAKSVKVSSIACFFLVTSILLNTEKHFTPSWKQIHT